LNEIYDEAIGIVENTTLTRAIASRISLLNTSLDQIPEEKEQLSCLISPTNDSEEKKREWKLPNVSLNL
jgi:hypothetical protein